jgi:hypothetical protein
MVKQSDDLIEISNQPDLVTAIRKLKASLCLQVLFGFGACLPMAFLFRWLIDQDPSARTNGGPEVLGILLCLALWGSSRAWLLANLNRLLLLGTARKCQVQIGPERTKAGDPLVLLLPQMTTVQLGRTGLKRDFGRFASCPNVYVLGRNSLLLTIENKPIAATLRAREAPVNDRFTDIFSEQTWSDS